MTHRLFFSFALCMLLVIVLLVVNNTKYATLREPLVFSDFFLYLQAIHHPRLYFPFLGWLPIVLLGLVVLLLTLGFAIEQTAFSLVSFESLALLLLSGLGGWLLYCRARIVSVVVSPDTDCKQYGVLSVLAIYAIQAPLNKAWLQQKLLDEAPLKQVKVTGDSTLPDIVVVQSESFFDARGMDSNVQQNVLEAYDRAVLTSAMHGKLEVPAWGANTMRSEFAFLTGYHAEQLGLSQFYPYQQLLSLEVPSIVGSLKKLGYITVCIHPHAGGFFQRDVFFKKLGFDEFYDEADFQGALKVGPYTADSEVTKKIKATLSQKEKPCFIFAITMENHGPLHLEQLKADEWKAYFYEKPRHGLEELSVYLRHLKNADSMVGELLNYFARRDDVIMGFYGDHVPAISTIFSLLDYDDPRSNYFLWSNFESPTEDLHEASTCKTIKIESLAARILQMIEQHSHLRKS